MSRHSQRVLGWVVLAGVALAAVASADAATLKDRARLREGASKDTVLIGWVEAGVPVQVEGERNGWYAVRTPAGQKGYIWGEHLVLDPSERAGAAPDAAPATAPPAPGADTPTPAADTGEAVASERDAAAELDRLRDEVARLVSGQQELLQRLRREPDSMPADLATDGSAGAAAIFLGAGALAGWIAHWLVSLRRDRRPRIRF